MRAEELLLALDLPEGSRLDRRVPKTLLLQHGGVTAADRRLIGDGVEVLRWVAVLKPTTVAIAAHHDAAREYLEVNVLSIRLRSTKRASRLIDLVHRSVPYPIVLVIEEPAVGLSLAHKRSSHSQGGAIVLDGSPVTLIWNEGEDSGFRAPFLEALALTRQPRRSLLTLYQGWVETIEALEAARRTGRFALSPTIEQATARHAALGECSRLGLELANLRKEAARATQLANRVSLNLEVQRIESALTTAESAL